MSELKMEVICAALAVALIFGGYLYACQENDMKRALRVNREVAGLCIRPLYTSAEIARALRLRRLQVRMERYANICLDIRFGTQYRKAY